MKYIIDTHALLWFQSNDNKLSEKAKKLISENDIYISIVSFWEIAIKISIEKLKLNKTILQLMQQAQIDNITTLGITQVHIETVAKLPFFHRDPFDRMLISQAISENIPIISADIKFDLYNRVQRIW